MDVGTTIKQARIYLQLKKGMTEWPKEIVETESAFKERQFYYSYDRNFNDEQMCANCKQFCFKGIRFCTRCRKALKNRDNPNEWAELGMAQRIDFANAALSELVWKANTQCRSLFKPYGPVAKR